MTLSQLVHISPKEQRLIDAIIVNETEGATCYSLAVLDKQVSGVDIALFGRMLADSPGYNVEAAVQVAHAITTHKVAPEVDFFTAVDDLNKGLEESGSGHLGEFEFGSGLFYHYICINKLQLLEHLEGEIDLVNKAIQALIEAIVTVSPNGKQNSFAALSRAAYVLVEAGSQQPRSLALAFFNPVNTANILQNSIMALTETRDSFDTIYGRGWEINSELNILTKSGSLAELKKFVLEV
jgi:CRISPR system Cascade subunit CasC